MWYYSADCPTRIALKRGGIIRLRNAALESVDMLDQRDSLYTTLSGGEKQRVQTARVLAQVSGGENGPSSYLMLDEPTSSLDLSHQFHDTSLRC